MCAKEITRWGRLLFGGALMLAAGSAFAASNLVVNQTDNPDPGAAGGISPIQSM